MPKITRNTCTYTLNRGKCGKSCTYNVYGNQTHYCTTHYAMNILKSTSAKSPSKKILKTPSKKTFTRANPPNYKELVIKCLNQYTPHKVSLFIIIGYIKRYCASNMTKKEINTQTMLVLYSLLSDGTIVDIRGSYALKTPDQ